MQPEPRQELEWCPRWCHQTMGQALETEVTTSCVPRSTLKHLPRPLTRAWTFVSCSVTTSDPGHWCFFKGVLEILAQSEG